MNYPPNYSGNFGQEGYPQQPQQPYQNFGQQAYPPQGFQQPPYMSTPPMYGGPQVPNMPFASWGARFGAYLIDFIIVFIPLIIIGFIVGFLAGVLAAANGSSTDSSSTTGAIAGTVLFGTYCCILPFSILLPAIYFIFFWTKKNGQTLGDKLLNIRVVSVDGTPITTGKALLRYLGYIVNGLTLYIGWLWPLWDPCKQGLHDKIAGTYVIRSN